jgi:hypothetical protein
VDTLWFSTNGRRLYVQAGAWLHALDVEPSGLTARRTRALPDPDTRTGPAADGQGTLLVSGLQSALPDVRSLAEAQSWASASGAPAAVPSGPILARLQLTVNERGEVRPAGGAEPAN